MHFGVCTVAFSSVLAATFITQRVLTRLTPRLRNAKAATECVDNVQTMMTKLLCDSIELRIHTSC